MSTKHVRTTGDIMRFRCTLQITCWNPRCQRQVEWNAITVLRAFGERPIEGLSRRLRCTGCGFKNASAEWKPAKG